MEHALRFLFAFGCGMIAGSFLNVVIYRLPRNESIAFPASHCTSCGTPIRWYDNVPVLSYLMLHGACRSCGDHISPVYPLVELATGLTAGILALRFGLTLQVLSLGVLASVLIAATMIDLRYMIIPDKLNAAAAVAGIILSFRGGMLMVVRNIAGAMVGAGLLLAMYLLGRLLYRREGVGLGDVKLAAVMGLYIGPLWNFVAFLIAILIGGTWGIVQLATGRKLPGQEVPFGPFLAAGGFFVLFFHRELLNLITVYLSLW